MSHKIRIMVVDDHGQVHRGLNTLNDIFDDMLLVAHANNGRDALDICAEQPIDVILMDVIMPVMDGIEATGLIHEKYPHIHILALSSFHDEDNVRLMLQTGAEGYVLKDSSVEDIAQSIRAVNTGKNVFSPEVTQVLLRKPRSVPDKDYNLTERELEVLTCMVKGDSNKEIAERLSVSLSTVKFHVSSILLKMGTDNRVEAVANAIEHNLVT